MALIHCDFFSEVLNLSCSMVVLLPQRPLPTITASPPPKLPTLYLLHGLSDDHTIWQRRTAIERYAEEKGIAVVMPAVHRSFYTDMAAGYRYWSYISEEVPARARDMFPLSHERADNFVAGLSMGGYGAFKLALRHPERFAAAASLSGALDMANVHDPALEPELRLIFGDLGTIAGSDNDLFHLAAQVAQSDGPKPCLFQWCGTEDFLYGFNVKFRNFVQPLPFDYTYSEGPGDHTWGYWDTQIQNVLNWLPLL
ncbi:MAG: esterase family protein [Chloroflexi bacterium]|nr:esterase family protein [Ardenticatenaceae bacterium]MBL1128604.1 esterase family protein [Chloroflexota bacterium]NOG34683.1 esterase family protein [Chloroflexota bacterium]GIK57745.1 MAG: esterase [Chloroflexota bacterium]